MKPWMRRVIVAIVLLVCLIAAGRYLFSRWFEKAPAVTELKLSGNIEAHESLVSFRVSGRIVELPVEEGQTKKADEVLARLDSDDYRQQVAVDRAAAEVRQSQLALGLAGSRAQEREAARQAVVDAQADLEQKQKDLLRYQALYEKDEVTGQVRDQAATNVTRARAVHDRARQIYEQLQEGTRKEQLAIDRATLRQSSESLRMSRIRLGYTVLRAPFDGVVLVRQAELGEVVAAGAPVVSLADLDHVWVRVYVPARAAVLFTSWVLSEEGQKMLATSLGKGVAMKGIQPKFTEFQVTPDFVVGLDLGAKLKQYIRDFQKIFGIS